MRRRVREARGQGGRFGERGLSILRPDARCYALLHVRGCYGRFQAIREHARRLPLGWRLPQPRHVRDGVAGAGWAPAAALPPWALKQAEKLNVTRHEHTSFSAVVDHGGVEEVAVQRA